MVESRFEDIPKEYMNELRKVREEQLLLVDWLELNRSINLGSIRLVAGFDTAFDEENNIACSGVVLVDFSTLEIVEEHFTFITPRIPYIPSFLHYREAPGYHTVFKQLEEKPDILLFDGNGIIHPYGVGIASQMGLELKMPTIGIAKKLLFGEFEPPLQKFGYSEITHKDKIIGAAFQSADKPAKPIYISQGHMIDLTSSIHIVREFVINQKFRTKLPSPILLADRLVNENLHSENPFD